MELKDVQDQELVKLFQSGQEEAFTELMNRYKEKAMQLAFVTVANYEDAKDIAQEAFVKVHHALPGFEMRSEFSTWFYRVLMNTAKDHLRKRKWNLFIRWNKAAQMDDFFEMISDTSDKTGKDIVNSELGQKMTEAIKKLPFQQQWIFTLRYLKGFSLQQIVEVTELSEGTVKSTLHFAVQKFRKEIFPYLQEGESYESSKG